MRWCVSLFLFVNCSVAGADLISPLWLSNYNPLTAIHGLPQIGNAEVLPGGTAQTRLMVDVSSHYAVEETASENLLLDGETNRATLIYQQGVGERWQLGVTIPYIQQHGGSLDSFINDWHEFFGMPEGGRDQAQDNQFQYYYSRDGKTRLDLRTPGSGIGDVRLQVAWQLSKSEDEAAALELAIKLPTGDSANLRGSGAADLALWYKNETRLDFFGWRGGSFYSLGALYMGDGDVLPDMVRHWVGFGGLGAGVYLSDSLLFISQLDINTPFYSSSDLVELNSYAVQLTVGGSIVLTKNARINLGVAEDLVIDASPDVTFHLDAQWRF